MKKILILLFVMLLTFQSVFAKTDKTSEDYLKTNRHISAINPLAEGLVEHAIKNAIKKEAKGNYSVKFRGYTLASIKKGIFKYLEITGKNAIVNDIHIPYFNLRTITDYNWIEYNKKPVVFKSDITFETVTYLSEESINDALEADDYKEVLAKVNKLAYPLFNLHEVKVKIKNDKIYIIMKYTIPLTSSKEKTFVVSSKFKVDNGKIKAYDIVVNKVYGNVPLNKVANLIKLIDPLSYTINLIDDKKCNGIIEDIKIEGETIIVNGKIYIKKDNGDN